MPRGDDGAFSLRILKVAETEVIQIRPLRARRKVLESIEGLSRNPRPARHERIDGPCRCRLRVGFYRVLYEIDDDAREVTIIRIRRRRFGAV